MKYNVCYAETILKEVTIEAKNKTEAKKQAKRVLGDDIVIDGVWELAEVL